MTAATTVTFPIENLSCASCAGRATRALQSVGGVSAVSVNLADETAQLTYDAPQILESAVKSLHAAGYPPVHQQATFEVSGMSCASCVGRLEKALLGSPGVESATAHLADETATVSYVPGVTDPSTLVQVATQAGYPAKVQTSQGMAEVGDDKAARASAQRNAMLLSAILAIPVVVLEMGGHLIPAWHHFVMTTLGTQTSWMVQFVLTTLILIGPGRDFFTNGSAALRRGAPNMNSLVALGAGAAWMYSTFALFLPGLMPVGTAVVYFEAAAVIVTLILLGRWFESRAKGQTGAAIRSLIGLQPRTARVQSDAGWVDTALDALRVGDVILIRPGERVPIDARVLSGTSQLDESMITGEPIPVAKTANDGLTGGTVNGSGSLTCEVVRVGQDTTLAQIIRMVQQAQGARLPIQALVDRVTMWFVPMVLAIAVVTVLVWLAVGPPAALSLALVAGVSVLIIACPCAMGLATPTSIMVGTGRAAELGVLFRQGDALQTLGRVDVVAFDKTGTLTMGKPVMTTFETAAGFDRNDTLRRIAGVEDQSEHPLARAIVDAALSDAKNLPAATAFQAVTGQGVRAIVEGATVAIGNAALMRKEGADPKVFGGRADDLARSGNIVFFASIDGQIAALIAVSDPVKPESRNAIADLKTRGIEVAMITGDGEITAQAVASDLGISTVIAGVLPDEKVATLTQLSDGGRSVAFVGDGINDAPVLAQANVGIAIGTGTDVAIETADVVLMSGDISAVVRAIDVSKLTLRNIRQNLFWAFGYNALLIPVAAGVLYPAFGLLLSPGLAAGAMAFSSVFVLANALRLRRI